MPAQFDHREQLIRRGAEILWDEFCPGINPSVEDLEAYREASEKMLVGLKIVLEPAQATWGRAWDIFDKRNKASQSNFPLHKG